MLQQTYQKTILWFDPSHLGPGSFKQSLIEKGWLLKTIDNPSDLKLFLQQNTTSVFLFFTDSIHDEYLKVFTQNQSINVESSSVLISSKEDDELMLSSINELKINRYIELPINEDSFLKYVEGAFSDFLDRVKRRALVKEFNSNNKKLEELTQGQEKIIQDRIASTEISKLEAEGKQKRIKSLINFIHEVSTVENVEDFLTLVRKAFRKLPHVGDVFIGYSTSSTNNTILLIEKGQVVQKKVSSRWPSFSGVQISSKEIRQFLANEIRRPFAKLLCFNLQQRVVDHSATSVLFIEHSAGDEEVRQMLEHVMERMQPMSIALDRVLLSERWRSTAELWEKTFDALNEPLCIIDLDYNLLRSNSYFGPYKKKCYESFKGHSRICEGCPVDSALKNKTSMRSEVKREGKIYEVHSYPILFTQDKKITTVVNYYVDVTEHKELYSKLLQSEKMAALGSMAGHIAHELNNPLTGIRSLSQILSGDEKIDNQHRSDLKEIEKAAARSQLIIKNLLEFTNPAHEEDLSIVSLGILVEKTLPMIKTALRFHRTEINNQLQDDLVKVNANLVQQVIFNIVNNSCQAMQEPGEISVTVFLKDDQVYCRIQDTGPGIAVENREKIFEPFYTTKKEGEGTGLGLSVSRSIIEKFGGHLYLEDTETGASFIIQLPRYTSDGRKYENSSN